MPTTSEGEFVVRRFGAFSHGQEEEKDRLVKVASGIKQAIHHHQSGKTPGSTRRGSNQGWRGPL